MIEIELPDGTIVEFPDGTGEATISQAIQNQFGAPKPFAILPLSEGPDGTIAFDSNAGVIGAVKDALTLPGDVATGRADPMSDKGIARTLGLAVVASPINPAVRSGSGVIPGAKRAVRRSVPAAPTSDVLKSAAKSTFEDLTDADIRYPADRVARAMREASITLEQNGFLRANVPKTFNVLDGLVSPPDDPKAFATFGNLHSARKALSHAGKDFSNPAEQSAARVVRGKLDEFLGSAVPGRQGSIQPERVAKAFREANANYAAGKRSEALEKLLRTTGRRTRSYNSGHNLGNNIRGRVTSFLENQRRSAGFSQDEIGALDQVVTGSASANRMREIGNRLGGGGGIGGTGVGAVGGAAGAALGGAAAGPPGAALGAAAGFAGVQGVGSAARTASNQMTRKAFDQVVDAVRKRSPLYEQMARSAPMQVESSLQNEAVMKAMIAALMERGQALQSSQ